MTAGGGSLPAPTVRHPIPDHPRVGFLAPFAAGRANVSVGEWTYADDPAGLDDFFDHRGLCHFDVVGNPARDAAAPFESADGRR